MIAMSVESAIRLTTPGIRAQQLQNQLDQLAQQQLQGATRARELSPPGPLRDEHRQAVIALEERTVGLRRLQDAFQQTAAAKDGDRERFTVTESGIVVIPKQPRPVFD